LYEYSDLMAQLRHPGMSRCMSDIYRQMNMDGEEYREPSEYAENDGLDTEDDNERPRTDFPVRMF
jgi:hypothetical protein